MNNKLLITLILIIGSFFFCCREPGKEEHKNNVLANPVSQGQKYSIDTKESVVAWKGSMLLASDEEHTGYVYISKGELMIEKGQLIGGTAEIDMHTIEYKDKEHKNSPIKHLKSADYFDVEKFPISTFSIIKAESINGENIKATGNLTIKSITHPITFPAKINAEDEIVKMNGQLIIDRTDWGISFSSGKFYNIVADQIVSDDIEFNINIVASESAFRLFKNPK